MSHAWGQTVPSNYGRLPPSQQREFHSVKKTVADPAAEIAKASIEKITKAAVKNVKETVGEQLSKQITPELVEKAQKLTAKQMGDGASESAEVLMKKNLKNLAEEAGEKVGKQTQKSVTATAARKGTEESIEKTVKAVPESAIERLGKRAITVGGIGITGFAMFNSFLNSDALDDYVASTTGRDCDEKAEEAGLEPGTQEYTDRVTECQEKAVENMAFLGKAMTYGGLGIGALVAVSILAKIGIFKKGSKSSDDEE